MSVKDSQILRECPFCGGEASKRLFYKGKYRVHCNVCDAHSGDVCDTEAEAIAAWNTRVDYHGYEQAAIEAWESIKAWNSRFPQLRVSMPRHNGEKNAKFMVEQFRQMNATLGGDEPNSRAERTCAMIPSFTKPATLDDCQEFCCSACGEYMVLQQFQGCADDVPNYCPNCGAKVLRNTSKCSETTTKVVGE